VRFAKDGALSDDLFAGCLTWMSELLDHDPRPDILAIEELLPPTARFGTTNTATQHRLAGLHGIVRGLAKRAGVPEIISATVPDIRQHFIHHRTLPRVQAKRAVAQTCALLGWAAQDSNCADALALWSYASAMLDPKSALLVTPLFGHQTWDDVAREREAKR
jgi:hypothetical protein